MISSNLPKKGVDDFVTLARLLSADGIHCRMIGPENAHVAALRQQQQAGQIPEHLVVAGYVSEPGEALMQGNVLVNHSHFQESCGRTGLEARAARRSVVTPLVG